MHPLHVIAQLLQILDVAIAYFADDELCLVVACARTLAGLHAGCCRRRCFARRRGGRSAAAGCTLTR